MADEITKIQVTIRRFLYEVRGVRHEASEAGRWLDRFCTTLEFQDLDPDPEAYASSLIDEARKYSEVKRYAARVRIAKAELVKEGTKRPTRQQIEERLKEIYAEEELTAAVKDISTQDAPNGNAGVDVSDAGNGAASKSPTSCDQFTADGDIREDSQAKPDGSAITRNETRAHDALGPSANIYGDAHRREAWEVFYCRESGDSMSTTVSRNMRRVPQNEAPAHGLSGGRTAQGTMSRSPEAAAQSGKAYDQEAAPTSTDEDRQSQRAGGNSLRVAKVSTSPARSAGPAKYQHGEFGNVMLTDDEFAKLCEKCQDADSLITELDQYIESQGKTKKYKSHYATLLNWSRRKAQEAKTKQGYMTSDDISKKNYEESKARLEAMFSKGRKTA